MVAGEPDLRAAGKCARGNPCYANSGEDRNRQLSRITVPWLSDVTQAIIQTRPALMLMVIDRRNAAPCPPEPVPARCHARSTAERGG